MVLDEGDMVWRDVCHDADARYYYAIPLTQTQILTSTSQSSEAERESDKGCKTKKEKKKTQKGNEGLKKEENKKMGKHVCKGWVENEVDRKEGEERLDVTQNNKMSGKRTPEGRAERNRLSC